MGQSQLMGQKTLPTEDASEGNDTRTISLDEGWCRFIGKNGNGKEVAVLELNQ